jgi:hypothetical protein
VQLLAPEQQVGQNTSKPGQELGLGGAAKVRELALTFKNCRLHQLGSCYVSFVIRLEMQLSHPLHMRPAELQDSSERIRIATTGSLDPVRDVQRVVG